MVLQKNDATAFMNGPRSIPLDQKYHYDVFVKETLKYKVLPWKRVSNAELNHVYNQLLNHFAATAESDEQFLRERAQIKKTWPRLVKIMRKCSGLVSFMEEYGVYSRFFYPFLLDVPRGVSMLPAYFLGRDIFGVIRPIPTSDAMFQFCEHDPVFRSVRFRTEFNQRFMKDAKNPLLLGPGTVPEVWFNDYQKDPEQHVTAYDIDTELKDPLNQIFEGGLAAHNIDYHFASFEEVLKDEDYQAKHDLLSMMGLASYNLDKLDEILAGARRVTTPEAVIVLDLQLAHPVLIFDVLVLNWVTKPMMKLCKDANDAIERVAKACNRHNLSIDECQVTPHGGAGIVFKISKR